MDARGNPFAPGAGTPPPALAGRSSMVDDAAVAIARSKRGQGRSELLLGLRGVGKTVLLNRIWQLAEEEGCVVVSLEAPEDKSFSEMLVTNLRSALMKLSVAEKTREVARQALATLRSFASAFKLKIGEVGLEVKPGTADSGVLDHDLTELFEQVASVAKSAETSFVLLVDEVQYLSAEELSALIVAVHRLGQRSFPFVVFGAGLPQLAALAGEAKSYAERLFDYPKVGSLTEQAAREAIETPIKQAGHSIEPAALDVIVTTTGRYPYFLQEWGYHAWIAAPQSPITVADVKLATKAALERLDDAFFRVRFDRLTAQERRYVRLMAELGTNEVRSGEVAEKFGKKSNALGPLRDGLIKKGMIYSPRYGYVAFTVPMFDEYLKRTMPND
jgi:hypothetical protein